jgi:hypothetical protein
MRDERFEVRVSFDAGRGYVASHPELRSPVTALSLGGLPRPIEALMMPDDVITLNLDRAARRERDRRRQQAQLARRASVSSPHQWRRGQT